MGNLEYIEAETPAELYEKVRESGGTMLSMSEVMARRVEAVLQATDVVSDIFPVDHPDFPKYLTFALVGCPIWRERYTTNTHIVRVDGGYRFTELDLHRLHGVDMSRIVDGGIKYPEVSSGRFLDEDTYEKNPGGCYPVTQWMQHPVLVAAVGDDEVLRQYGAAVYVLSGARFYSPGRESIWCPQALEVGTGRAFALGMGADAAYPPNATTRGHWTVVRK